MSHFSLLRDPSAYAALDWDILADPSARTHWLDLFQSQFADVAKHALVQYGRKVTRQVAAAQQQFDKALGDLRAGTAKLSILDLGRLRQKALRDNGLHDPYTYLKDREARAAAQIYLPLVRKLHALPASQKWLQTIQCLFAADSHSLGGPPSNPAKEQADFAAALQKVKPRPWLADQYEPLAADLASAPPSKWSKAVFFADKGGGEFVLGAMPLLRELGLCGTKIVLAANELPSLNDATADGVADAVEMLGQIDDDLASLISAGMIEVVSTGSDISLLDLSQVSDELNEAAAGAELVILAGPGRAVQCNYSAAFAADSLKLAVLKDPTVARRIGGVPGDCICKYEPAPAAPAS